MAIYMFIAFKLKKCASRVQRLLLLVIIMTIGEVILQLIKSRKYITFIYKLFKKTTNLSLKVFTIIRLINILFSFILLYYVLSSCNNSDSSSSFKSYSFDKETPGGFFKYSMMLLGLLSISQIALIIPNIREKADKDITILDYSLDLIDTYESLIKYIEDLDNAEIDRTDIIYKKTQSIYYNEAEKILANYPNIAFVDISPLYSLINQDMVDLIKTLKAEH